jgi:hypothetical protein
MPMRACSLMVLVAMASAGCTHHQLRHSTLQQAGTITDIHYHQVLSNIASYHDNLDVLPHFAVVGTGGSSVNDQVSAFAELEWNPSTFARQMYVPQVSREVQGQWTLAPVINPDKLRAIRCLFQLVVSGQATDPEADKLLTDFLGDGYMHWVQRGWYGVGQSKQIPKGACYAAHCGDKYVWVPPEGVEGLSRLTLVVLNIAALDRTSPDQPTKTVKRYTYNKDGRVETEETLTRLDPDAPKAPGTTIRRDFFNPLQSQIQLRGR